MKHTVQENYVFETQELNEIDFINKKVIMITAHRRENWGLGIENICEALNKIVEQNADVELVYLVHLNPVVKDVVVKAKVQSHTLGNKIVVFKYKPKKNERKKQGHRQAYTNIVIESIG